MNKKRLEELRGCARALQYNIENLDIVLEAEFNAEFCSKIPIGALNEKDLLVFFAKVLINMNVTNSEMMNVIIEENPNLINEVMQKN
jgi:hypothetical protein